MDKREDIMRHFPKLLSRWKGKQAILWELTTSHKTLRIVLFDNNSDGSLIISCLEPERIEAPLQWENSNIQVIKSKKEAFNVIDKDANVFISECGVEIKEFEKKPFER